MESSNIEPDRFFISKFKSENITVNGGISIDTFTLTSKQVKFFTHARHMAEMSDFHRAPVGCVAVIGSRVVATGFSQQRTHPMQQYFNRYRDFNGQKDIIPKLHAETAMLFGARHLPIEWSKADIYIYRICRSRPHGLSCPCESCRMALAQAGIKNCYFTTDDGYQFLKIA